MDKVYLIKTEDGIGYAHSYNTENLELMLFQDRLEKYQSLEELEQYSDTYIDDCFSETDADNRFLDFWCTFKEIKQYPQNTFNDGLTLFKESNDQICKFNVIWR